MNKATAKELIKALAENQAVQFSFVKKNGEVREALATKQQELYLKHTPKTNRKEAKGTITFFDLAINEWRCLREDAEIKIKFAFKKSAGFDCEKHIVSDTLANALFNSINNK
jgi:hypothetical protein